MPEEVGCGFAPSLSGRFRILDGDGRVGVADAAETADDPPQILWSGDVCEHDQTIEVVSGSGVTIDAIGTEDRDPSRARR